MMLIFYLAFYLLNINFVLAGKSDEKCNEYINLSRQKRDIGKIPTSLNEFPHMAAVFHGDKDELLCGGGVLISDQYVLTSAVCAKPSRNGFPKTIRLGVHNLTSIKEDPNVQEFTISSIIVHPDYKAPSAYNDIALIKLSKKVIFTESVRPACLQTETNINQNTVLATGWGLTESNGTINDILRKVELDLYSQDECNKEPAYSTTRKLRNGIISSQICAGGKNEEKSTCQGDSGGPYQILRPGQSNIYNIVGIISFGLNCGLKDVPEVGTRVSSFIPWIESVVWP